VVAWLGSIRPAKDAPVPLERRLINTVAEITLGTDCELNHLIAKMEGELKMNTLPIAQKTEPIIGQVGFCTCIKTLIHTPKMTNMPPSVQPILIPNLSRIILHGVAIKGCIMGLSRTLSVTITEEY
jgi:hypothetical protein